MCVCVCLRVATRNVDVARLPCDRKWGRGEGWGGGGPSPPFFTTPGGALLVARRHTCEPPSSKATPPPHSKAPPPPRRLAKAHMHTHSNSARPGCTHIPLPSSLLSSAGVRVSSGSAAAPDAPGMPLLDEFHVSSETDDSSRLEPTTKPPRLRGRQGGGELTAREHEKEKGVGGLMLSLSPQPAAGEGGLGAVVHAARTVLAGAGVQDGGSEGGEVRGRSGAAGAHVIRARGAAGRRRRGGVGGRLRGSGERLLTGVARHASFFGWGDKKRQRGGKGESDSEENIPFLPMPSAPYWKSPQLSYATLSLRAWSKPHACCRTCPSRGKSSTSCPGIVQPLPYPNAVGCTSCASKQEACAKPGCGGCA